MQIITIIILLTCNQFASAFSQESSIITVKNCS